MTKYRLVSSGEWVRPVRHNYGLVCCDCGLVYTVNFRIRKGKIEFQMFRNERATKQLRKAEGKNP